MDCVNHPGTPATAFCQNCGKALCGGCVRTAPGGQVLCEPCFAAWQTYPQPFVPVSTGSPNPAAAAVLGLIPGVGAMYNGQFFKGLIHVVIFAVLVSMAHVSGIFGIFIPAWILYQSFEAFHTAKALRDGLPVPDPLGLNDVGNWLNLGKHPHYPGHGPGQAPVPRIDAEAGGGDAVDQDIDGAGIDPQVVAEGRTGDVDDFIGAGPLLDHRDGSGGQAPGGERGHAECHRCRAQTLEDALPRMRQTIAAANERIKLARATQTVTAEIQP